MQTTKWLWRNDYSLSLINDYHSYKFDFEITIQYNREERNRRPTLTLHYQTSPRQESELNTSKTAEAETAELS